MNYIDRLRRAGVTPASEIIIVEDEAIPTENTKDTNIVGEITIDEPVIIKDVVKPTKVKTKK